MKTPASSRRPTNISNMIFNFLREKAGEHTPPLSIKVDLHRRPASMPIRLESVSAARRADRGD